MTRLSRENLILFLPDKRLQLHFTIGTILIPKQEFLKAIRSWKTRIVGVKRIHIRSVPLEGFLIILHDFDKQSLIVTAIFDLQNQPTFINLCYLQTNK
jgi:hypothetical protein